MIAALALPAALAAALLHGANAVPLTAGGGATHDFLVPAPEPLLRSADTIHRQLQAGAPDKCTDDASYQGWLALVK